MELPAMAADAPLGEVKAAVKARWGMPTASQHFVLGSKAVDAADGDTVAEALLATAAEAEVGLEDAAVELSCVRGAIPEDEQRRLDNELLRATAVGDHAAMAAALSEGARPDVPAEGGAKQGHGRSPSTPGTVPSPLMMALAARDDEARAILLAAGAREPDMAPVHGGSLGRAFGRGDLADVVRVLARGANPNLRLQPGEGIHDTSSGTPLHACCALWQRPGAAAVAGLLCRLGADVKAPDAEGDSPLSHARYFGADEVYNVLEAFGAKLQGPYYSALHVAGRKFLGWR